MNQLRIIFMGTPEFAVGILDTIIKNNYNVVGVITAADKPAQPAPITAIFGRA